MLKKIGIMASSILALLLITLIVLNNNRNDNASSVLSVKTVHSYVSNDTLSKEIEIPLYFDSTLNDYRKEKQIKSCYITDYNENYKLEIKLKEIVEDGETLYANKTYYRQIYTFELMKIYSDIAINDAYLLLESSNSSKKIYIGSFNLIYKELIASENDISLDGLYCVTPSANKKIDGIVIKLSNKTEKNIVIKKFIFNTIDIKASGNDIISLSNDVSYNESVAKILNKSYDSYDNTYDENTSISFKGIISLFIPLKYLRSFFANNLPIVIEYEMDDKKHEMVIDNYLFFDNYYNIGEEEAFIYEQSLD